MDLFRKMSLEKIASPEQLDRQIVLIPRSFWSVFLGCGILLTAVILWGFLGSISMYEEAAGVVVNDENQEILCFVTPEVGNQLAQGMKIAVRPLGSDEQTVDSRWGQIEYVQTHTASSSEMAQLLNNDRLEEYFEQYGPVTAVFGRLSENEERFPNGKLLSLKIVTEVKRPVSLLFPNIGKMK